MISVLRREPYERLVRLLDLAVRVDETVAESRHTILAPLRMLDALGREVPEALGSDRKALERLRLLVTLSAAYTPPTSILGDLGNLTLDAHASSDSSGGPRVANTVCPSYETIIQFGALALVGLAVARLGAEIGLAHPFIQQVHGLAVAAGPAEALSRAAASGMNGSQASAVLSVFMPGRNGDRHLSAAIGAFLSDPCEQARWRCVHELFQHVQADARDIQWEWPTSALVSRVEPATAGPGADVVVTVTSPRDVASDVMAAFSGLEGGKLSFAFEGVTGPPQLVTPVSMQPTEGTAVLRVPDEWEEEGWIGLSVVSTSADERSREALRRRWAERNATLECLRGDPVPVDLIPDSPAVQTPAHHHGASITGGAPRVAEFSVVPSPVNGRKPVHVRWRVEGGATQLEVDGVAVAHEPEGGREVKVPDEAAEMAFTLRATSASKKEVVVRLAERVRGRVLGVDVSSLNAGQPLVSGEAALVNVRVTPPRYAGRCEVSIDNGEVGPAKLQPPHFVALHTPVTRAIAGRARLVWLDGEVDDEVRFGPIDVALAPAQRVLFVRPAAIASDEQVGGVSLIRASLDETQRAFIEAARLADRAVVAREPSWVDDAVLGLTSNPDGPEHAGTRDLLTRLHLLAAQHAGVEDAIWMAVLPDPADERPPWSRWEASEVAALVGVATLGALAPILRQPLAALPLPADCLRILATVDEYGRTQLDEVVQERRRAWPAAGRSGSERVVMRDREGATVQQLALRTVDAEPVRHVVMLCAAPPGVASLEVRSGRRMAPVQREQPTGEGHIIGDALDDCRFSWEHAHSSGARVRQYVDVAVDGVWSPWLSIPPCEFEVELPVERIPTGDVVQVRLRLYDGWQMVIGDAHDIRGPDGGPVVLRLLRGTHAWADGEGEEALRWVVGGDELAGAAVRLPVGFAGALTVARAGQPLLVVDRAEVVAPADVRRGRTTRSMPGYAD